MELTLYHGSENQIEVPQYGKGARTNDYGRGFYCTESKELAKEWACAKNHGGYANQYVLDLSGLRVLRLNQEPYHILNWLAILAQYRTYWQKSSISEEAKKYIREHFFVNVEEYDVVIGHRADDSYFSFAQDFVSGTISLQKLSEAMRLGRLGEQIVLKSRNAFERIRFMGSEEADAEIYFDKKKLRDREARREYRQFRGENSVLNEIYILDIMREGMENDDPRLR